MGKRFVGLIAVILLVLSCQRKVPNPAKVVARVGDAYLTIDMVTPLIPQNLPAEHRSSYIQKLVNQWVDMQILAQTAHHNGFSLDPHDQWEVDMLRMNLLAQKYINREIGRKIIVTDKEIEDYYNANKDEFKRQNEEVHLVHLFLEKRDPAIQKDIRESNNLLEVIQKNYLDQRATPVLEPNGDLGYVVFKQLRPIFQRYLKRKKTGVIVGPIRMKEGYHYFQILDRQPAGSIRSLDLVRDEIIARLQVQKRNQEIHRLIDKLKEQFEIELHLNHIPVEQK